MKKKQVLEDNAVVIDKKLNQYETAKLFPKKVRKINENSPNQYER